MRQCVNFNFSPHNYSPEFSARKINKCLEKLVNTYQGSFVLLLLLQSFNFSLLILQSELIKPVSKMDSVHNMNSHHRLLSHCQVAAVSIDLSTKLGI